MAKMCVHDRQRYYQQRLDEAQLNRHARRRCDYCLIQGPTFSATAALPDSAYCGSHRRMFEIDAIKYVFRVDYPTARERVDRFNRLQKEATNG